MSCLLPGLQFVKVFVLVSHAASHRDLKKSNFFCCASRLKITLHVSYEAYLLFIDFAQ